MDIKVAYRSEIFMDKVSITLLQLDCGSEFCFTLQIGKEYFAVDCPMCVCVYVHVYVLLVSCHHVHLAPQI